MASEKNCELSSERIGLIMERWIENNDHPEILKWFKEDHRGCMDPLPNIHRLSVEKLGQTGMFWIWCEKFPLERLLQKELLPLAYDIRVERTSRQISCTSSEREDTIILHPINHPRTKHDINKESEFYH